jgi:hypothetical protein
VSEYESPQRIGREPTVEDVRELVGPSTPHFAPHIRNRIRSLIAGLAEGHPARVEGEMHIARLERIAFEGERRGPAQEGERELPSIRGAADRSPGPGSGVGRGSDAAGGPAA